MKIRISDDEEFVKEMKEAIKKNNGYCPCQVAKNENTKCICKNFLEDPTIGWCHCMLYYKEEI